MDCIFCAIVAGDVPCHKVYEDDETLAFLDIGPLADGHCLIIPKTHGAYLTDLTAKEAGAILAAAQIVRPAVAAATRTKDATMAIHDGPDAGQEVKHVHLHVVPRKAGDSSGPIHALFKQRGDADAVGDMAARIREALS